MLPRTMYSGRAFHTWEAPKAMGGQVVPVSTLSKETKLFVRR